jgi:hypothetical protein
MQLHRAGLGLVAVGVLDDIVAASETARATSHTHTHRSPITGEPSLDAAHDRHQGREWGSKISTRTALPVQTRATSTRTTRTALFPCIELSHSSLNRREALHTILERGVQRVLAPAGFERAEKMSWVRRESQLSHVVSLLARRGMYDVQWGVVSVEIVPILWGSEGVGRDVGLAAMSGTPGSIRHPAVGWQGHRRRSRPPGSLFMRRTTAPPRGQALKVMPGRVTTALAKRTWGSLAARVWLGCLIIRRPAGHGWWELFRSATLS